MTRRAREHTEPTRPDPEGVVRLVFDLTLQSKANAPTGGLRRRVYTPRKVKAFEKAVHFEAIRQMRERCPCLIFPMFTGRVSAAYRFYFARNPTNRDLDNCFKSVNDALEGVVYRRDSQIWRCDGAEKFFDKVRPRIEIEVRRMEARV
jgi:Holliday junction resolvase RusA-like endonuclease